MRKTTTTIKNEEALNKLWEGIEEVADPVIASIGARGRNGAFRQFASPTITNDGVTIARMINPKDPFARIGADLCKEAAERTNDVAGDGTTTTVLLNREIVKRGMEEIKKGYNPMVLRTELEAASKEVVELIKKDAHKITKKDELYDVAKISVEDGTIAEIITDSRWKVGAQGVVIADEGVGYSIEKEEIDGYFFDSGFLSEYMITNNENGKPMAILQNPVVIVTDRYLNQNMELIKILNSFVATHLDAERKVPNPKYNPNIVVIADNVQGELLQTMVVNKIKGNATIVAVKRPPTVTELEDIATITGATAVTGDKGIKEIGPEHVGTAKEIRVGKNQTLIIGKGFPAVKKRLADLDKEIEAETSDNFKLVELKERRAKLAGGIVHLKVGAKTEQERRYLKLKVDDAVCATKAALEEGIVDGAGRCLYDISEKMSTVSVGAKILSESMKMPREMILKNSGLPVNDNKDYDVLTGKIVKDLKKSGIIDPAKVERCSVENAVSAAAITLTISSVTVENEDERKERKEE